MEHKEQNTSRAANFISTLLSQNKPSLPFAQETSSAINDTSTKELSLPLTQKMSSATNATSTPTPLQLSSVSRS